MCQLKSGMGQAGCWKDGGAVVTKPGCVHWKQPGVSKEIAIIRTDWYRGIIRHVLEVYWCPWKLRIVFFVVLSTTDWMSGLKSLSSILGVVAVLLYMDIGKKYIADIWKSLLGQYFFCVTIVPWLISFGLVHKKSRKLPRDLHSCKKD